MKSRIEKRTSLTYLAISLGYFNQIGYDGHNENFEESRSDRTKRWTDEKVVDNVEM